MSYYYGSTVKAMCADCGYTGTPYAVELHSCAVQEFGGRCEDYPCCGHTDGDGCQTRPEHTSAYWAELMTSGNSRFAFEPGSPEWYDAADMDDRYSGWDDAPYFDTQDECVAAGEHGNNGHGTATPGVMQCECCPGTWTYELDEYELAELAGE